MLNIINEDNFYRTSLPSNSSLVNFSQFNEFKNTGLFRSFCIKMVVEGCEQYTINGKKYLLRPGQYLLANQFSGGTVQIASQTAVKGICIDISPSVINDVYQSLAHPYAVGEPAQNCFFTSMLYPENINPLHTTKLGNSLLHLTHPVTTGEQLAGREIGKPFFYQLATELVTMQLQMVKEVKHIKAVKAATKKELLRKLYEARQWMESEAASIRSVSEISQQINISEFHFQRLFKQVFGFGPYQYLTLIKLRNARQAIEKRQKSLTEIAIENGYSDLATFSKSFKRVYKTAPSALF